MYTRNNDAATTSNNNNSCNCSISQGTLVYALIHISLCPNRHNGRGEPRHGTISNRQQASLQYSKRRKHWALLTESVVDKHAASTDNCKTTKTAFYSVDISMINTHFGYYSRKVMPHEMIGVMWHFKLTSENRLNLVVSIVLCFHCSVPSQHFPSFSFATEPQPQQWTYSMTQKHGWWAACLLTYLHVARQ